LRAVALSGTPHACGAGFPDLDAAVKSAQKFPGEDEARVTLHAASG